MTEDTAPAIPAMALRLGDRFVVEPPEGDEFEATLTGHYGWGMTHGQIELAARRGDGEEFLYSIHFQAPVRVIRREHWCGLPRPCDMCSECQRGQTCTAPRSIPPEGGKP